MSNKANTSNGNDQDLSRIDAGWDAAVEQNVNELKPAAAEKLTIRGPEYDMPFTPEIREQLDETHAKISRQLEYSVAHPEKVATKAGIGPEFENIEAMKQRLKTEYQARKQPVPEMQGLGNIESVNSLLTDSAYQNLRDLRGTLATPLNEGVHAQNIQHQDHYIGLVNYSNGIKADVSGIKPEPVGEAVVNAHGNKINIAFSEARSNSNLINAQAADGAVYEAGLMFDQTGEANPYSVGVSLEQARHADVCVQSVQIDLKNRTLESLAYKSEGGSRCLILRGNKTIDATNASEKGQAPLGVGMDNQKIKLEDNDQIFVMSSNAISRIRNHYGPEEEKFGVSMYGFLSQFSKDVEAKYGFINANTLKQALELLPQPKTMSQSIGSIAYLEV